MLAGLFLECPSTTAGSLRSALQMIKVPIQSMSIYDFDRSVETLTADFFAGGVHIRHLQFSHSHLKTLRDDSLQTLRTSLESFSIVNSKLEQVSIHTRSLLLFVPARRSEPSYTHHIAPPDSPILLAMIRAERASSSSPAIAMWCADADRRNSCSL